MGQDKRIFNEARHPYIVQLSADSIGLDLELNRRIQAFHKSRRLQLRYGRSITTGEQIRLRWCFSDLATARAFVEKFGAILVRSRFKGHGLGWLLMRRVIDYEKEKGLQRVYGDVLVENTTMLQMCAELGFRAEDAGSDIRRVVLDLEKIGT